MSQKALVILAEGFEEIEAIAPIDILRRAGIDVTVASLDADGYVTGKVGMTVQVDRPFAEIAEETFDLLVLPGGPGHKSLRESKFVLESVRRHAREGKIVGAICAAPTVLHEAGILAGRRYTAHYTVADELTEIQAGEAVVRDGNVLTSRGAGTAVAFGLALVRASLGEAAADEVAASIHEPATLPA